MQKEPDYVPDGARLVQICGLCAEDGHEISFAPDDIAALMKGYEESADGSTFVQAMYERMLFGNKAFKELFRALEAGETPILFHCSAGKDRTGVAAMLILLALGASDETICADYERTNLCRKAEIDAVLAEHAEEIAANPACRMRYYRKAGVDPATAPFVLRTIRAKLRQRRELSGSRIRPDPCAPDAAAQDVSGINGNGDGIRCGYCPCFLHKMFCGAGFSS